MTDEAGIESKDTAPLGDENLINVTFSIDSANNYSFFLLLICTSPDDNSFWIKMDDDNFEMMNGLGTTTWAWITLGS